jgi:hypothetical protein
MIPPPPHTHTHTNICRRRRFSASLTTATMMGQAKCPFKSSAPFLSLMLLTQHRFRVQGSGFRVQGSGFRVQALPPVHDHTQAAVTKAAIFGYGV